MKHVACRFRRAHVFPHRVGIRPAAGLPILQGNARGTHGVRQAK